MKDYVSAIIKIEVPKWQIGERASIHFPDTMCIYGICESTEPKEKQKTYSKCLRCGRTLKQPDAQERGYGKICWQKHLTDKQITLF